MLHYEFDSRNFNCYCLGISFFDRMGFYNRYSVHSWSCYWCKQIKKPVEAYTLEEFNLILKLADEDINPTIKLIMNLALLTGIRRGELGGLMWKDVNFDEGYIFFHQA